MLAADTLEALGIKRGDYVIKVNNRKVLDGVLESRRHCRLDDGAARRLTVLRAVDKLDRLGQDWRRSVAGQRPQGRVRRLHARCRPLSRKSNTWLNFLIAKWRAGNLFSRCPRRWSTLGSWPGPAGSPGPWGLDRAAELWLGRISCARAPSRGGCAEASRRWICCAGRRIRRRRIRIGRQRRPRAGLLHRPRVRGAAHRSSCQRGRAAGALRLGRRRRALRRPGRALYGPRCRPPASRSACRGCRRRWPRSARPTPHPPAARWLCW